MISTHIIYCIQFIIYEIFVIFLMSESQPNHSHILLKDMNQLSLVGW